MSFDRIHEGDEVRHMDGREGVVKRVVGDFVWVQLVQGGEPEPFTMGYFELINRPQGRAA
jgi:hypothetical protein